MPSDIGRYVVPTVSTPRLKRRIQTDAHVPGCVGTLVAILRSE
jgi:hypothetical protein